MDGANVEFPGCILREARKRAGLSQRALGGRAGVTQSVISAYESGARQPSLPTLRRLVAAAGFDVEVQLRPVAPDLARLSGPLGRRVQANRTELNRQVSKAGMANLRVFGSVARAEETPDSDVDLLVDTGVDTGLFALASLRGELERLLNARVDLVPSSGLKAELREAVLNDAVSL